MRFSDGARLVLVASLGFAAGAIQSDADGSPTLEAATKPLVCGGGTSPRLIPSTRVEPEYPVIARLAWIEGRVVFKAIILKDGSVGDLEILLVKPPGMGFDESATEAVRQWRYEPSILNGRPVDAWFTIAVEFTLDDAVRQAGDEWGEDGADRILRAGDGMAMVRIPASSFTREFLLDRHEVTIGQYASVIGEPPPGQSGGLDHPVVNVTWIEAGAYCEGVAARLPTDGEWEHAARGGLVERRFPWGDEAVCDERLCRANCGGTECTGDGFERAAPVCSYPRTEHGLCDMAGNVWEWVGDWSDPDAARELRGGSWLSESQFLLVDHRSIEAAGIRLESVGFRCARNL
jgi:TonB family protein